MMKDGGTLKEFLYFNKIIIPLQITHKIKDFKVKLRLVFLSTAYQTMENSKS